MLVLLPCFVEQVIKLRGPTLWPFPFCSSSLTKYRLLCLIYSVICKVGGLRSWGMFVSLIQLRLECPFVFHLCLLVQRSTHFPPVTFITLSDDRAVELGERVLDRQALEVAALYELGRCTTVPV